MRKLTGNQTASAIPVIIFFLAIFICGALYTLFFIELAYPELSGYIPASDSKTFIMMCMYAIPLTILLVGVLSLLRAGLKRTTGGY